MLEIPNAVVLVNVDKFSCSSVSQLELSCRQEQRATQDTDDEAQSVVNEVRFLAESAQHPNVVKLHGTFCVKWRSKSRWLLALEMCSGGRLRDHVKIYGHLERIAGEGASVALLSAVAHLHSRRVLHRDIQPGNILLAEYLRSLAADILAFSTGVSAQIVQCLHPGPVLINFGNACRFEDAGVSRLSRVDAWLQRSCHISQGARRTSTGSHSLTLVLMDKLP